MKLSGINKLTEEELEELDDTLNPFSFEQYCVNCDNFRTDECPFKYIVDEWTKYENVNCNNFMN